jgi:class 3 adenylate cyclase
MILVHIMSATGRRGIDVASGEVVVAEGGPRPRPVGRVFGRLYARGGVGYVRRALFAQLSLGLVVALVGALLTLLFAPGLSAADLIIIIGLSELIYVADGALAVDPIRRALRPLERWSSDPDATTAREAWEALADLPFALLRRRAAYVSVIVLVVVWDLVGVSRLGLSAASFLLFLPGSLAIWLYWLALRFFVVEQILRPVLAELSHALPAGGGASEPRVTLARRLLIVVPAITITAGAVVAGVVGDHTLESLAVGIGVSIAVAAAISSWLVVLLADSVAGPIAELRRAADLVGGGDLQVQVPVVSVDETGALARAFNAMVGGLRERERIREAFGTYVDRDVAEHILREGTSLAGEEVEVTALFLDIRDFTGYAERSPAPEVVGTLNRLFERIVPLVHEHGGHVDKFVGDGLLAVFGAPRRQPDHADQALAAALTIAQAVEQEFGRALRVGIGLNSGTVVAGNVGGAGRLEFSVIGDAVNIAARVESATRQTGDTILVSDNTRRLLRRQTVTLTERPPVPLKGKREPVALFAPDPPAAEQHAR